MPNGRLDKKQSYTPRSRAWSAHWSQACSTACHQTRRRRLLHHCRPPLGTGLEEVLCFRARREILTCCGVGALTSVSEVMFSSGVLHARDHPWTIITAILLQTPKSLWLAADRRSAGYIDRCYRAALPVLPGARCITFPSVVQPSIGRSYR